MTPHQIAATAFNWDFSVSGHGVIIGIVDSGIDLDHPEFMDANGISRVLLGTCLDAGSGICVTADDKIGGDDSIFSSTTITHGTHVAGIAAGLNVGLAYDAWILPVKVCSSTGSTCPGDVSGGVVWAAQHGASVINVSIGGGSLSPTDITDMQAAVAAGALIMVAAGNAGNNVPASGYLPGAALLDGIRGSMIVVGATAMNNVLATFSQVPGTHCEVHGGINYCLMDYFVVAPGAGIISSVGGGTLNTLSGTSMATPYVTGVAALIKSNWPYLTSDQIANVIFDTAIDLGAPGDDPIYGRGAVNITAALSPYGPLSLATTGGPVIEVTGTGDGKSMVITGPLAGPLSTSSLLRNVVVFDSFHRNFNANISRAALSAGFSFNSLIADQLREISPFSLAMNSDAFGTIAVSGFVDRPGDAPVLISNFAERDETRTVVRDLALSAELVSGISLDAGYNLSLSHRFNDYDAGASPAYNGLFLSASAVNSPYVGLTDGGSFIGSTVALTDDLRLRVGVSSLQPQDDEYNASMLSRLTRNAFGAPKYAQRQANEVVTGLSWDFADWGGLGIVASQTVEYNGLLGGMASGAFSLANAAATTALGASMRVGFGDGWVTTASWSEGLTQLDLKQNGLVSAADPLHSRAYGVALAKHGVFGDADSLGLAVTRPVYIYSGGGTLTAATSVDANGVMHTSSEHISFAAPVPETDFEFGYAATFFGGALSWQADTAYQMNLNGLGGENAVAVFSRLQYHF